MDDRNEIDRQDTPAEGGADSAAPNRSEGAQQGATAGADEPGEARADDAAAGVAAPTSRAGRDSASTRAAAGPDITSADIEIDLKELRIDLEKTTDRYLRLAAEFDNYRKRVERERGEMRVRSQAELAAHLLDAIDDLHRVADFEEDTSTAALLDGVRLVEKKLGQALASFGLERVDAAGKVFDPATMEALAAVPAETPQEDDVVADVFQPGYLFKGQLIRPARVRVKKYEG